MRVLGIDPGLRLTGYGCVEAHATSAAISIIEAGVFRLARRDDEAGGAASVSRRLRELDADFRELLDRVQPGVVAVEGLFTHAQFPATSMIMGHARGVLLLAIAQRNLPLVELKPTQVKKFLTGSGRADKGQMQRAVQQVFCLKEVPSPPDVADALAIALCAAHRQAGAAMLHSALAGGMEFKLSRGKKSRRTLPRDVLER